MLVGTVQGLDADQETKDRIISLADKYAGQQVEDLRWRISNAIDDA
jgi:hypothetical protein